MLFNHICIKRSLDPGTLSVYPRRNKQKGLAIKVVPELLGNDTLDSQVFTFIFEAVPMYGLT